MQSEKYKKILSTLEKIEFEMKKIGVWDELPLKFSAENYLAAPSFELWLQCVFLPNARRAAQTGEYPSGSQVGLMAMREYGYHGCVEEAHNLIGLLHDFDELVVGK